ncbi:myb-like protein X [Saccostrea cucullata]|uniref:myb-like protein X n=1 Tax=Saccostrea cuccullata TaxID=36930 RepID=UPI002ED231B1
MDFDTQQSAVNKRKRSCNEEREFEAKKLKLQSDTDLNGSLQPPIYHGKEISLEQQVFETQPIKIESENDDQQARGNKDDLDSDCFREIDESVDESSHGKEILFNPVEILTFGSETTSSTNLIDVKEDKDGNCIEHAEDSKKTYIPIEVSSTKNFENENKNQAQSPKYIEKQFENLSRESSPISFWDENSSAMVSKPETTISIQLQVPENKENEYVSNQGDASQVSKCNEGSFDSEILSEKESSKNYDIYIEKDGDTNVSESTLIVKEIVIEENGPAPESLDHSERKEEVSGSLEKNDDGTKDRNDPKDKDDSEKYLYRLLRPEETYNYGIFPKNRHSSTSLEDHVRSGSSSNIRSKFISCSKSLDKIRLFAGMIRRSLRHELRHIVRIDRTLMGSDLEEIDLTDTSVRETRLMSERSRKNSLRFEEIILVPTECIPAASVKRIGHVQNGSIHIDD